MVAGSTLTALFMTMLVAGVATGGRNAGGALIVHTNNVVPYRCSLPDGCGEDYDDPGTCEEATTRIEVMTLVWFLAAFDEAANPGVTSIDFGLDYSSHYDLGTYYWYCGPEGTASYPDAGWPTDPAAGNSIRFGSPIVGQRLLPFYYICFNGSDGDYVGTKIHPNLGYAAFTDDSEPPVIDGCGRFGRALQGGPGYNECPTYPADLVACCFDVGNCLFFTEDECAEFGGQSQGAGSPCDPNPCLPPERGACCFADGACLFVDRYECAHIGGLFQEEGTVCDPNPCPQPPVGACCMQSGDCAIDTQENCAELAGAYQGDNTSCDPNPCPGPGACCLESGSCIMAWQDPCLALGGTYLGREIECDPNPCGTMDAQEGQHIEATWGAIKARYR